MAEKPRVLILGGEFGGMYAALEFERALSRGADLEVTLVNQDNFFLFTPMLHEVATSDLDLTDIVNPVRKLFRQVTFFHGDVESIDLVDKRVTVSHGHEQHGHVLPYDHLILALGLFSKDLVQFQTMRGRTAASVSVTPPAIDLAPAQVGRR